MFQKARRTMEGTLGLAKSLAEQTERVIEEPVLYETTGARVREYRYMGADKNITGIVFIQSLGRPLTEPQRVREVARIGAIRQVLWLNSHRQMTDRLCRWEGVRQEMLRNVLRSVEKELPPSARALMQKLYDINADLQQMSQKIALYSGLYLNGCKASSRTREVNLGMLEESLSHLTMLLGTLQQRYRRSYELYYTIRDIEELLREQGKTRFVWQKEVYRLRRLDAREQRYIPNFTGDELQQRILELTEGREQCWQKKLPRAESLFKTKRWR